MKDIVLDKYALNRLSDKDKAWIKQELFKDPAFQEELDLHSDIVKGIDIYMESLLDSALIEIQPFQIEDLKNKIKLIDEELESEDFFEIQSQENKKLDRTIQAVDTELEAEGFFVKLNLKPTSKTPVLGLLTTALAAACILLMLTFSWQYLSNKTDYSEKYTQVFEPYENILSESVILELSEKGFAGNPEEESLQQIIDAMSVYDKKNYSLSIIMLSDLLQKGVDKSYQSQIQLYLGLSCMGDNQISKAIPVFLKLIENDDSMKETATWYIALCYLKNEDIEQSEKYLITLKNSAYYNKKASNLLKYF
jgi:hypothetical protein